MSNFDEVDVELLDPGGKRIFAKLVVDVGEEVVVSLRECSNVRGCGRDLFSSFCDLRKMMEPDGWRFLCAGSRADVYPSAMSRSMGDGRQAYLLREGRQADMDDLLDIFSPASREEVVTVEEQRSGYKKWLRSLGLPV